MAPKRSPGGKFAAKPAAEQPANVEEPSGPAASTIPSTPDSSHAAATADRRGKKKQRKVEKPAPTQTQLVEAAARAVPEYGGCVKFGDMASKGYRVKFVKVPKTKDGFNYVPTFSIGDSEPFKTWDITLSEPLFWTRGLDFTQRVGESSDKQTFEHGNETLCKVSHVQFAVTKESNVGKFMLELQGKLRDAASKVSEEGFEFKNFLKDDMLTANFGLSMSVPKLTVFSGSLPAPSVSTLKTIKDIADNHHCFANSTCIIRVGLGNLDMFQDSSKNKAWHAKVELWLRFIYIDTRLCRAITKKQLEAANPENHDEYEAMLGISKEPTGDNDDDEEGEEEGEEEEEKVDDEEVKVK